MTETPIADQIERDTDGYVFRTYPATAIPVEGVPLRGRFLRLEQGLENEYGRPWIAVFTGVDGLYRPAVNAGELPVENGAEYGLWLIHSVLRDQLRAARPASGEMFAVLYKGSKPTKADPRRSYHAYQVDMPERSAPQADASWDSVEVTATEDRPDF